MLREVKNGALTKSNLTLLGWRWRFVQGNRPSTVSWSTKKARALLVLQTMKPVAFMTESQRSYWVFEDRFYWENEGLTDRDVLALVREREIRVQRKLQRALQPAQRRLARMMG